jgi:hypothetical protein
MYHARPIFFEYIKFHYGRGIKEFFVVTKNFLWFIKNFFSFSIFIKTLFSPWHHLGEKYGSIIDLGSFASTFVINTIMRILGFSIKVLVMFIGSLVYIFSIFSALALFIVWIFAPAIIVFMIVLSIIFLGL